MQQTVLNVQRVQFFLATFMMLIKDRFLLYLSCLLQISSVKEWIFTENGVECRYSDKTLITYQKVGISNSIDSFLSGCRAFYFTIHRKQNVNRNFNVNASKVFSEMVE